MRVANAVVIDANSEVIIPACLASFPITPVIGLVDVVPKLIDRYHLFGAPSVSVYDEHGRGFVQVCNPSEEPILLHKGTTVGKFTEMTPFDEILPVGEEPDIAPISAPRSRIYPPATRPKAAFSVPMST